MKIMITIIPTDLAANLFFSFFCPFLQTTNKNYSFFINYSFFQPLISVCATELLIAHPIVNSLQNFEYGLPIKRKEKYIYIWKCNNNTNNSKKRNSGK